MVQKGDIATIWYIAEHRARHAGEAMTVIIHDGGSLQWQWSQVRECQAPEVDAFDRCLVLRPSPVVIAETTSVKKHSSKGALADQVSLAVELRQLNKSYFESPKVQLVMSLASRARCGERTILKPSLCSLIQNLCCVRKRQSLVQNF